MQHCEPAGRAMASIAVGSGRMKFRGKVALYDVENGT